MNNCFRPLVKSDTGPVIARAGVKRARDRDRDQQPPHHSRQMDKAGLRPQPHEARTAVGGVWLWSTRLKGLP